MNKNDNLYKLLSALKKRDEILIQNQPISKYNYYFKKMTQFARMLIEENRQDELLPFLEDESISIQNDVAGLLYHFHPDLCSNKKKEIADMQNLPRYYRNVSLSAKMSLEYGIPKNFP